MSSLRQLLVDERDATSPVSLCWDSASRADRIHRWAEFRTQVADLSHRIEQYPMGPWVLLTEDAYAFAVGLLALWQAGRHAISPPNRQPAALRLLETRATGVISDLPDWSPEGVHLHPLAEPAGTGSVAFVPLRDDAVALELFTSGTTGPEKPVLKRIAHLDQELQVLAGLWDARLGDASILASASHQHLYGLLFGVLWPLAAGRVFYADHLLHARELLPRARQQADFALVSVPAHLKRLGGHLAMASVRDGCRAVFSSGGPLSVETAHRIARLLGCTPIEVLGSTETGGFAWRTQQGGDPGSLWTPFPGVELTRDPETEAARVCSPFANPDEFGHGVATGDRIELRPDGRFELKGRVDRVVKVGEKRIDLNQMESHLRAHPCVADAALTLIHVHTEPRIAAAVVPTERGWDLLRREGSPGLRAELTATLAEYWDPVLLPRYWRTIAMLPENPQGKVTAEALGELFRADETRVNSADRPEVLEEVRGRDFRERLCRVPEDLSCFSGHFPDAPIVPAVLQLDWVMDLVADLLEAPPGVEGIDQARFSTPLRPGDRFRLRVQAVREDRIDFRGWNDANEYVRGRARIGPGSPGPWDHAPTATSSGPMSSGSGLPPIADLLPHRGGMVLLDRLLQHDEVSTSARVVVATRPWLRRADGSVPAWIAVEYMAQCAAAHEAVRREGQDRAARGFLVAVRDLRFGAQRFEAGAVLRVHTRRDGGRPGLGVLSHACSVHADTGAEGSPLLAQGRVIIALDRPRSGFAGDLF